MHYWMTPVKDKLGIPGVDFKLILSTMHGSEEIGISRVDGLVVERIDQRVQVELPRTYSRDQIPSRRDQIPSPEVAAVSPKIVLCFCQQITALFGKFAHCQ